ncbi:MAG: 30S ribosome-binding factor RbfA [Actinomycetota bacterium]
MARRPTSKRNPRPVTKRHFPRTARLNTLLQEIVADHLERVDDDRLGFLTVTGVEVDADLNKAQVFISALADESEDEPILEALEEHRKAVQGAIARSARIRKVPEVVFAFDPAVRAGARIEDILAGLDTGDSQDPAATEPGEGPKADTDNNNTDNNDTGAENTNGDNTNGANTVDDIGEVG